jgi:hypothetical protein
MKSFYRKIGFSMLGLAILGTTGCQESNESLVDEQARKTAGAKVESTPPPKSQAEFGQASQKTNPFAKGSGSGYPGTGAARK